jgi:hypothetical protein
MDSNDQKFIDDLLKKEEPFNAQDFFKDAPFQELFDFSNNKLANVVKDPFAPSNDAGKFGFGQGIKPLTAKAGGNNKSVDMLSAPMDKNPMLSAPNNASGVRGMASMKPGSKDTGFNPL